MYSTNTRPPLFQKGENMRYFEEGDRVALRTGFEVPNILHLHKGNEFIISKVVKHGYQAYYEMDGCVSRKGVPYGVTADWLKPVPKDHSTQVTLACVNGGK